jgi:hypothetical protein
MAQKSMGATPIRAPRLIPRWLMYVAFGGGAGLIVGIASLFVVAVFYGEAMGLSPLACTAVACLLTLLFSQPAGVAGMVAGATVGAVAGVVVHYLHHSARPDRRRPGA